MTTVVEALQAQLRYAQMMHTNAVNAYRASSGSQAQWEQGNTDAWNTMANHLIKEIELERRKVLCKKSPPPPMREQQLELQLHENKWRKFTRKEHTRFRS